MAHSEEDAMVNLSRSTLYLHDLIKQWETYVKALEECSKRWKKAKTKNIDAKEISLGFEEFATTIKSAMPGLKMAEQTLRDHYNFQLIPPKEKLAAIHVLIGIVLTESKRVPGPGTVWRWDSDYDASKHAMKPLNDLDQEPAENAIKDLYLNLVPLIEIAK
jgi:hypothetical protein